MPDPPRPSLQEILLGASELTGQDRRDYVERACNGDAALRAEVESLLAFDTRTPSILDEGGLGRVVDRVMREPVRAAMGIGDTVDVYTLREIIGEGGMGVVYRASQAQPIVRDVALKLIRRGFDTERVVARFETERQVLARMDHPGIARVFDAGATGDGRPFFVMELVDGRPITAYADQARLSVRDRVALMRRVCLAVQHAHQKGVIHRDLKPSNILVAARDADHEVKVIDFGIAKATVSDDNETLLTREGQFVGTPNYMSPEQAGVIDADVDTRTDVYALGVVLYEMLAGRRPHELARATPADIQRVFESSEAAKPSTAVTNAARLAWPTDRVPADVIARVAEARGSTPARLKRDLVGDLDNIVLKAIEKSPDRRYASMEQFAGDLARFLEGRPVLARPATLAYRSRKFVQRHTLGVGLAATGVLVLAAFVTTTIVQSRRLARERDRAVAAEQRAKLEAETASRTTDFLTGLFRVSDPSEAAGRSVTAFELLQKGATAIGDELKDQPALQARLLVTMGNVYKQLGLYPDSAALLEQAVEVRERTPGLDPWERANALDALGDTLRMARDARRAASLMQQAVDLIKADPSTPDHVRASAVNNLGLARQELGEYDQAEPLLLEALAIRRRMLAAAAPGKEDASRELVASSLNNIGLYLNTRGKYREAETVLRESLALRQAVRLPRLVSLASTRVSLAQSLMRQEKLTEAEPLLLESVADRVKVLGPEHPRTIDAVSELANLLHDQGKYDQAEVQYRRVVNARATGKGTADYAVGLNNLASLLEDRGDFRRARPLFEESLAIRRSVNGPNHPSVGTAMNNLGRLHFNLGDYEQAAHYLNQAMTLRRERMGDTHVQTAATLMLLARVQHARGQAREAEAGFRKALETFRTQLSASHASVVAAEVSLGRVLTDLGRSAEAVPLLRHAVEVRASQRLPAATAWRLAEAQLALGRALAGAGRAPEGQALMRRAAPAVLASPAVHLTVKAEARRALARP